MDTRLIYAAQMYTPDPHGAWMNMQSHPIRVLLIDDDEDDYIVVRDLLSDISSIEFILEVGFRLRGCTGCNPFQRVRCLPAGLPA